MTDALHQLAAMGEDWPDEPTGYNAKVHRQDPESWAERMEAKSAGQRLIVAAKEAAEMAKAAHDTGPAAENIARAFEG